jgi:hypothetical protein
MPPTRAELNAFSQKMENDSGLAARFEKDPHGVLKSELGIEVADDRTADDLRKRYFEVREDLLSEEDLDKVAGGANAPGCVPCFG